MLNVQIEYKIVDIFLGAHYIENDICINILHNFSLYFDYPVPTYLHVYTNANCQNLKNSRIFDCRSSSDCTRKIG